MKFPWRAAGVSACGARHLQNNTPCQDSVRVQVKRDCIVLAVADGHGDKKHKHSDKGSQFAVEVACRVMESALLAIEEDQHKTPREHERVLSSALGKRISWEWNKRVNTYCGLRSDGGWQEALVHYGTTVLAAAFSRKWAIFFQLGDGDILLTNKDGSQEFIFSDDEDMYGTFTHSLCEPNSNIYARVHCKLLQSSLQMVLLSTDGIRDSLNGEEEKYPQIALWLQRQIALHGWDTTVDGLEDWLTELSKRGNGDDSTLAVVQWLEEENDANA